MSINLELSDTRLEVEQQEDGTCVLVCHVISRGKSDAIGYMPNRAFADFVVELWNLAADQKRADLEGE